MRLSRTLDTPGRVVWSPTISVRRALSLTTRDGRWLARLLPATATPPGEQENGAGTATPLRADAVVDAETDLTTITWFERLDSLKDFTGEDHQRVHVPDNTQQR